jgi:uncharacterized membrane protein YdjX (TVP38/TMEM64 family)
MLDAPGVSVVILAIYGAAGMLAFPITVLVIATVIIIGGAPAALYAFLGTMLAAYVAYALGRTLGRDTIRRFAASPLNAISSRLARRGVWAIAALRIMPVASFWRVNIVAGASQVRPAEFLLGTAAGIALPIAVTVLFIDRVHAAIAEPGLLTFVMAAPLAVLLWVSAAFARRAAARR